MSDDPAERPPETDKRTESVALPTEDEEEGGEHVVAQQNVGPDPHRRGQGEWPSPQAEPTGPAPGTTPEGAQAASRRDQAGPQRPPAGSASQPHQQQDATTGGDRGPARGADLEGDDGGAGRPEPFKDVLESDPVGGGSQAAPEEGERPDPHPG